MLALDASLGLADVELQEARESLAYWETRARDLPLRAVRRRREARELAARWRGRVAAAERARYGSGVVGFLTQLAAEGRVSQPVRQGARRVARLTVRVGAFVALM